MEKVYDLHIHYTFELSLQDTVEIFQEEFTATGTEKYCFLSLPHHVVDGKAELDKTQNVKGLYLKSKFQPNAYAFAGLVHPDEHCDQERIAEAFLAQVEEYLSVGYDGVKMLEGYPSLLKAWKLPLDSPIYDKFYRFMEENGYPILMHIANPQENWDVEQASLQAIEAGRVYDASYPSKAEITAQVFRVMERFPKLKLILAHFGFMSYDIQEAARFMSYPNTLFDVTPGGEQLIRMQKEWVEWQPFWEKHQERILYGTDFYAFPKDENWETAFHRRPKMLRHFFETETEHVYLDESFMGVGLSHSLRNKIYRENFTKLLGEPKPIDEGYLLREAERVLKADDLQYVQQTLHK